MKKILISVLIILLLVLAYFAMFNGISLGTIHVLSVEQIVQKNEMQKVIHSFPSKMERYLSTIKTFKNSIKGIYTPSYTQYPPLFYFFLGI